MLTAEQLIAHLGLQPLPLEGGYFRETWRSSDVVTIPRFASAKPCGTTIYYLLTSNTFSALHRLPTDEVYHFYLGVPVRMLLLDDSGPREVVLGPDVLAGQHVQFTVPRKVWQGSRLAHHGPFALLGTTMSPGFDFADYEPGSREQLMREFPSAAELISHLTGQK